QQRHRPRLARLEALRGTRRDVEAKAPRGMAVEGERIVGFLEVVMRADLDRPVAGVGDHERDALAPHVDFDIAIGGVDLSRDHHGAPHTIGWWTVTSLVPSGKVASTWISGTISGTPSITSSRPRIVVPKCISSATLRPSRAPSRIAALMRAIDSG